MTEAKRPGAGDVSNASAPVRTESTKTLPEGYVAIVRGESGNISPIQTDGRGPRFWVNISKVVNPPLAESGYPVGLREGTVDVFDTTKRGRISVEHLHGGSIIEIYPTVDSDSSKVKLWYFDYDIDLRNPLRVATIDKSVFNTQGFDLHHGDKSNIGLVLSAELSRMLFDFQEGQNQFANLPIPEPLPVPKGPIER